MCFREKKKKKKKATAHHHLGSFVLQTAQGHCRARSGRWWPSVPAVAGELVSEGELPLACQAPRLPGPSPAGARCGRGSREPGEERGEVSLWGR